MELLIKNMVCRHCVKAVEKVMKEAGIDNAVVELGRVTVPVDNIDSDRLAVIDRLLAEEGFERITDSESRLVERVKLAILHHVRNEEECRYNLSACLESHLGINYDAASRIFSHAEGRTIERYHSLQRIELVKELLAGGDLTLAEIADKTGYSSAAHLSRRFKEITGMTPTQYVAEGCKRTPLPEI